MKKENLPILPCMRDKCARRWLAAEQAIGKLKEIAAKIDKASGAPLWTADEHTLLEDFIAELTEKAK